MPVPAKYRLWLVNGPALDGRVELEIRPEDRVERAVRDWVEAGLDVLMKAPKASAENAARRAHEAGVTLAVVTLGKAGAVLCDAAGTARIPAFDVTSVDATAAGDAFVGALAVALGAGIPAREAVRLANAAGAAATTRVGAQTSLPRAEDLQRLFGLHWPVRKPTA